MSKRSGRVSLERGEEKFTAEYEVSHGVVTVSYWENTRTRRRDSAQLHGELPEEIARKLLENIVDGVTGRR